MSDQQKTCGNCRHWGKPGETAFDFKTCIAVVHDSEYMAAEWPDKYDEDGPPEEHREFRKQHKAVVTDESGHAASLHVREDFGCVLWEPRPAPGASPDASRTPP